MNNKNEKTIDKSMEELKVNLNNLTKLVEKSKKSLLEIIMFKDLKGNETKFFNEDIKRENEIIDNAEIEIKLINNVLNS